MLQFDTETGAVKHSLAIQDDYKPVVNSLGYFSNIIILKFLVFLSLLYKLPRPLYIPLEMMSTKVTYFFWWQQIRLFLIRQWGIKLATKKIIAGIKKKYKKNILRLKID